MAVITISAQSYIRPLSVRQSIGQIEDTSTYVGFGAFVSRKKLSEIIRSIIPA